MTWGNRLATNGLALVVGSLAAYAIACVAFAVAYVNGIDLNPVAMVPPFVGMMIGALLLLVGVWMESADDKR